MKLTDIRALAAAASHGNVLGLSRAIRHLAQPSFVSVTAAAQAATCDSLEGVVTSEVLSTAAGASYTLTLTNSEIAPGDMVLVNVGLGTASAGQPVLGTVTPGAGSATIIITNRAAAAALNGTIVLWFRVIKAAG